MMSRTSSIIIALAIIIGIPTALWAERASNLTWLNRLAFPSFLQDTNRHTPVITNGYVLPPVITKNTTFNKKQGPLIIVGTVTVPKNISLTIGSGVQIYAHEYASLIVEGTLTIEGTKDEPVFITTNEANIANQVWSGIIAINNGQVTLHHTNIAYASPAVSCTQNSTVNIIDSDLENGNVGLFASSPNCTLNSAFIKNVRDGIISVGQKVKTNSSIIQASHQNMQTF